MGETEHKEDPRQKLKHKYTRLIKKYLTPRKVIIVLLLLFLVLMFSSQFKGVLLLLLFFPLAKYSVKITAFVPHITLEQYTASSILMTYLYGPIAGSLSALVLGMYGYLSNSISKFLALTNVFVASFTCFVLGTILKANMLRLFDSFYWFFIIAIIFNNIIAYIVFVYTDPDQIQNVIYRISHVFWNCLIGVLFFNLLYNVYNLI